MHIQLHTLTNYAATLLNRDDNGFAKKIAYGGVNRTRISSQCLKRHWREYLISLDKWPSAIRSTMVFEQEVLPRVMAAGISEDVARAAIAKVVQAATSGMLKEQKSAEPEKAEEGGNSESAGAKSKAKPKRAAGPASLETSGPMLVGRTEAQVLADKIAAALKDGATADTIVVSLGLGDTKAKANKTLTALLGQDVPLGAGIEAALFGRFVTSSLLMRTDSAVSVQHAMTIHGVTPELDFFTAVDDLGLFGAGGSHIGHSELSAGTFYGYVSIDVPLLVSNMTGCNPENWQAQDLTSVKNVIKELAIAVATVSPGAKKGSTAPYSQADFLMAEVSTALPRSLAGAFEQPVVFREGANPIEVAMNRFATNCAAKERLAQVQRTRAYASVLEGHGPMNALALECPSYAAVMDAVLAEVK